MRKQVMIIDNDIRYSNQLIKSIKNDVDVEYTILSNFKDLKHDNYLDYDIIFIRQHSATSDLIKELIDSQKIVILLLNNDSDDNIQKVLSIGASNYIITSQNKDITIISSIVKRLLNNDEKIIMVVDDSQMILTSICILLDSQNLKYVACKNGQEALDYISDPNNDPIDLVVSDYQMPIMDGFTLLKNLRALYPMNDLPVLILSTMDNHHVIAKFLKYGANDYIPKPFIYEEFVARLSNTLNTLDMFREIKKLAMTDYLTKLHNRTYFYETGSKTIDIIRRNSSDISLGMMDIDNFKNINDTYGHDTGDESLKQMATVLKNSLRNSDICARIGGEEFVFLLPNCPKEKAVKIAEKIREDVSKIVINITKTKTINFTVSIGITSNVSSTDDMLKKADELMYQAKKSGKNRVISD